METSRFLADTLAEPVPVRRPGEELIGVLGEGGEGAREASAMGNTKIGSNLA